MRWFRGHRKLDTNSTNNNNTVDDEEGFISCPYVRMTQPRTSSWYEFVWDLVRAGSTFPVISALTFVMTANQKGILAALAFDILDIYRLDEVPGVSHPDLYQAFRPQFATFLNETKNDGGYVTLQDLVDFNIFMADELGMGAISFPSKLETNVAFIRAGGKLWDRTVHASDILSMMDGIDPDNDGIVSIPGALTGFLRADWKGY